MKIAIIASKNIGAFMIEECVRQGHNVVAVCSRDNDLGMSVWLEDLHHKNVYDVAKQLKIPAHQGSCKDEKFLKMLPKDLDIIFSTMWGEILPNVLLYEKPRIGCFNLHYAFLPKNRGCYPISWAILNDEEYTGVTIHKMEKKMDIGDIVVQTKVYIQPQDLALTLYKECERKGKELFSKTLPFFADESFTLTPQDEHNATYHDRTLPDKIRRAMYFPPFNNELIK